MDQSSEGQRYVNVSELCARWSLSRQAVYNLISSGKIVAIDLNAQERAAGTRERASWRITEAEANRWEAEQGLTSRRRATS
jgi:hypothetical protein